jgi:membrane-bound lytic murein transglycosylase B
MAGVRGRLGAGALATLLALASPAGSRPALATPRSAAPAQDSVQRAGAAATAAKAKVDALLDRYQEATEAEDDAVRALGRAFQAGTGAEVDADAAAAQSRRARAATADTVRQIYASGGALGVTATVLGATSPGDALWRVATARQVLGTVLADDRSQAESAARLATLATRRAADADAATRAQVQALTGLQARADAAQQALRAARSTLGVLTAKARRAQAARQAAEEIAAATATANAARNAALGTVTALGIPAAFQADYQAAAKTCPGLTWTLLAGIGQVESGHGRDNGPSSAGALGPMQFLPGTFARYAVDGDHDGVTDVEDPADAISTAAHYLCVSGRGAGGLGTPAGVHAAVLAYNHAEWYVELVLAAQQAIVSRRAADRG